jgi:hypothetical protein
MVVATVEATTTIPTVAPPSIVEAIMAVAVAPSQLAVAPTTMDPLQHVFFAKSIVF